jgi:hypothetical protein
MNDYVRACLRFWWLLLLAVGVCGAVAYEVATHHDPPTFSASLQMMVDSPSRPFLRTGLSAQPTKTRVVKIPVQGPNGVTYKTKLVEVPQPATVANSTPDTQALVGAANLFPSLIESDAVTSLRVRRFGVIPGAVFAKAEGAATTASGRIAPATFPIINISTNAPEQGAAIELARSTFFAFRSWLVSSQKESGVAEAERITVSALVVPKTATRTDHTQNGLAAVLGLAVLAGAIFYIVVLDKVVSRRVRKAVEPPEEHEQRAKAPGMPIAVPPEI